MPSNIDPARYLPIVDPAAYHYDLPADRIAEHPLAERDRSRLLVCSIPDGAISHHRFRDLEEMIPAGAMLVLNTTRVVRARIVMHRATGGRVELFLLEPAGAVRDPALALAAHGESRWLCMVGGARKLEREPILRGTFRSGDGRGVELRAHLEGRSEEGCTILFTWQPADESFASVLELAGRVPLPPYIHREAATDADAGSYQTVYAEQEGAVAAPTAGLHFTPGLLGALDAKGVLQTRIALHVGAGTFRQVKGDILHHEMHRERIAVGRPALGSLLEQARRRDASPEAAPFVIVGTTGLRTVESLYWFGIRLLAGECGGMAELDVEQWDPYRLAAAMPGLPSLPEALAAVDGWAVARGMEVITGRTGIMIVPGYTFHACDALITNFHQPESTLILLVGAMLGRDLWRRLYQEALATGYRFLSYGDGSLLVLDPLRMRLPLRRTPSTG
ncbi:MAG TPA: S-adenosylmethionine:tRNA ribosyltransferase-isomerase [Candidatus Kapabacteria bacterium]|nr:S-adenosylmethionine:tRNA ribosyltransferase-isomerase [Candidatus Kapabacteria bacterium]